MQFKKWLNEEQSQDALFVKTDKTGLGPKPSSNSGKPKPSDGWFRGKGRPTILTMKKESSDEFDPYEKMARELVYALDSRKGGRGENKDRNGVRSS
jgi:hypothetical protein